MEKQESLEILTQAFYEETKIFEFENIKQAQKELKYLQNMSKKHVFDKIKKIFDDLIITQTKIIKRLGENYDRKYPRKDRVNKHIGTHKTNIFRNTKKEI